MMTGQLVGSRTEPDFLRQVSWTQQPSASPGLNVKAGLAEGSMLARHLTAVLALATAALGACGGRPEPGVPETATPVLEGPVTVVWNDQYSDLLSDIEYQAAVVFRLRNPAPAAMPEASYRVRLSDRRGSVLHDSPSQRTALAPGESRYVVYPVDASATGNPADRQQVTQRAPTTATVTTSPSLLDATVIPPSTAWRSHKVRASCEVEEYCEATGEVEWTGDQPAPSPVIAVVAFDPGGTLVTAGVGGGPGEQGQLRPNQRQEFAVEVVGGFRDPPAQVEVVPYLVPD